MSDPFSFPVADTRRALAGAYRTIRTRIHRIGDAAERYAGAKIKRRVKPPIVAALVVAGTALVIGVVATFRK